MMLYLTGAASSLSNSADAPQTDVSKSLGGYISSSMVPNGNVNVLFDLISLNTLKNKPKETLALGLVNKFSEAVTNLKICIATRPDYIGKFKIAATAVSPTYMMEHIENRYAEPIQAEFHNVDFIRASVRGRISVPGVKGETLYFEPFDVTAEITEDGKDATMNAIVAAFSASLSYSMRKISNTEFEIISKDNNVVAEPLSCSVLSTEGCVIEFDGQYKNGADNTASLADKLEPGEAIGIWIQREVVPKSVSNEEMIRMYESGAKLEQLEEIELCINYDLGDRGEEETEGEVDQQASINE